MSSSVENNLKEILYSLVESKEEIDKKINELPPRVNLFRSLNRENDEVTNSMVLHSIFKVRNDDINIPQLFVEYLKNKFTWNNLDNTKKIEVEREASTEESRRIDLLIYSKNNFAIIIENKID